ncbi:hypothetical protein BGW80DRAFT_131915 [Lactifluus volemus]|nr:hypothetical protein BGW80DRAFT_131915 [Lactifluus volemus]
MQEVFDQHTQATRCRATKGGRGKLTCVDGRILSSARIQHFVATPCKDIIEDMRSLFHDLYLHVTSDVPQSMMQAREEQDPKVKSARKKLQTSDALLAVLDKHLQPEWDINDDGSLDLSEPHANSSGSRSRRKRKAEDSLDGSEENIHLRRIGRMPPRSSMSRSKDSFSSQTSSHHDDIFSMSSRMDTSSGGFSSNLRSMDHGSSAKQ